MTRASKAGKRYHAFVYLCLPAKVTCSKSSKKRAMVARFINVLQVKEESYSPPRMTISKFHKNIDLIKFNSRSRSEKQEKLP